MEAYTYQHIENDFRSRSPGAEYLEIGADGWETRKVEVFADGRSTYCDGLFYTGITGLSEVPAQSIDALNGLDRITARAIDRPEFERAWDRAHREPFTPKRLR